MHILKSLFWSSRPISWINTAYPFAAAYFITTGAVDIRLIIGTLFFLIPYNLAMYGVNDVFDYESDIRNPRKGGIEGAKLSRATHKPILIASAVLNIPFIITLLLLGDLVAGLVLLAVMFFVLAYSVPVLRFKERPFLDSFTSACHFVGPAIYAFSLTEFSPISIPIIIAFFLWGMASHAFGAVQDVIADREGNIKSIGTVMGARTTARFALVLYIISAIIVATLGFPAIIVAGFLLLYAANVWPYRNVTDKTCEAANKGWRRFIYINLIVGAVVTMVLISVITYFPSALPSARQPTTSALSVASQYHHGQSLLSVRLFHQTLPTPG